MADYLATGIDVSEFNGDVDFAALKGKIDFAILRCGYGGDYVNQDDKQYAANVQKCEAAGIPYGVYLYSYAQNTAMAKSEAAHTLRLLRGKKPLYGVWYDVEDSTLPAGEALIDNCVAYCQAMEAAGYYCGIYSFLYWMTTRLNSSRLDPYDKWVAQWNATLDYDKPVGLWQYTNKGVLNGKTFDLDRAFKNYPAIIGGEGGTELTKEEVLQLAQQVYDQNETRYKTMASLPDWARPSAERVYRELGLTGTGAPGDLRLNASETYARTLVVIDKVLDLITPAAQPKASEPEQSP